MLFRSCSVPRLTWFTEEHCARPVSHHSRRTGSPHNRDPQPGILPRSSGLRVQGTAISPDSTAFKNTDCSGVAFIIDEFERAVNRKSAPSLPAHAKGHIAPRAQDSARKPCGRRKGQNGKSRAQSAPLLLPAHIGFFIFLPASPGLLPSSPCAKSHPSLFQKAPSPPFFKNSCKPPLLAAVNVIKLPL